MKTGQNNLNQQSSPDGQASRMTGGYRNCSVMEVMMSPTANRPSDEIEVTPEMIRAASDELAHHYLGDGVYDVRQAVIREMLAVALKARREAP